MDYVTINKDQEVDFHQRVLQQSEADHMRAQLQIDAANIALQGLGPAPTNGAKDPNEQIKANMNAQIQQLTEIQSTAEATAEAAKATLTNMDAPFVPDAPSPPQLTSPPIVEATATEEAPAAAADTNPESATT